jgi:hypothetical protein
MTAPMLPYAGTSGWSGSESSRQRAVTADANGLTGKRQKETLAFVTSRLWEGVTWKDVANHLNVHHGTASGVLSVLHKSGHLARLQETRGRCAIYVHPDYVHGRDIAEQGRKPQRHTCPNCGTQVA